MNSTVKGYLSLFGVAGLVIALDQWTKWLVRTNISFQSAWLPDGWDWLAPYARIVNWSNRGAAFGMFQEGGLVFALLAFIVIGAIIYYFPHVENEDWTLKLAMGLQLGGAAGNLIDRLIGMHLSDGSGSFLSRLVVGRVTDFISVGTFPVFNVADSEITVGVIVLLLGVWLKEREEKKKAAELSSKGGQAALNDAQLKAEGEQTPVNSTANGKQ